MDDMTSFHSTVLTAASSLSQGTSIGDLEDAEARTRSETSRPKYSWRDGFDSPIY